jgi:WD40 repeat protein
VAAALLSPDWKKLYVPVGKISVKPVEHNGKKVQRFDFAGKIRVWDAVSGKELAPLQATAGRSPYLGKLAPNGRVLFCIEEGGYETDGISSTRRECDAVAWDLVSDQKHKLWDGFVLASFLPDGKIVVTTGSYVPKQSLIMLMDGKTGQELARRVCPSNQHFWEVEPAPDGSVVAVLVRDEKGSSPEVWLLDAATLLDRGKFREDKGPEETYWFNGQFTPSGNKFIVLNQKGNALIWDVATWKMERKVSVSGRVSVGGNRYMAISPDSKILAVGWRPKGEPELEKRPRTDPQDLPQPRITLVELIGDSPPRVLIAPHGKVDSLALSPDGKTLALGSTSAVYLFDVSKTP